MAKQINTTNKTTHSYRLWSLLKKKNGTATTAQLAAASGLKPDYVVWYMAELKRVYGLNYEHKRGDKKYVAVNLNDVTVPPGGIAGQRKGPKKAERVLIKNHKQRPQPVPRQERRMADSPDLDALMLSLGRTLRHEMQQLIIAERPASS